MRQRVTYATLINGVSYLTVFTSQYRSSYQKNGMLKENASISCSLQKFFVHSCIPDLRWAGSHCGKNNNNLAGFKAAGKFKLQDLR